MSKLWCLDCQKPFDALQGHVCVKSCVIHSLIHERVNRDNANFRTILDKQYGTSPITSSVTEEQVKPSASVSTKPGNTNPDFPMHTSLNNLSIKSNDQLNPSSLECATGGMYSQLMMVNSEQVHRGEYAIGEMRSQALTAKKELGTTSENKLAFNFKIHVRDQKETTEKEISNLGTSESVQSCSIDDAPVVAGPSESQDIERTCPLCHKEFSCKSNMRQHIKLHSRETPFTCTMCQKEFTRKDILKTHMLLHSGEKSHKCDLCGKCFARKGHLQSHLLTHVDAKPYKCETCGKTFKRRSGLKIHICRQRKVTL